MEREVWLRAGMFSTIIALAVLILVTPGLMGRPTPLASLPILVIGVTPDQTNLSVYVAAAVQPYEYDAITVNVTRLNAANVSVGWLNRSETYSYGVDAKVGMNLTYWRIHVWLRDREGNYFEDNVSVRTYLDPTNLYRLTMAFRFPDDKSSTVVTRVWPDDYRIAIPRRGTLP